MNRTKDWNYDEGDYLRLMKSYISGRIDVQNYQREFFSMNAKRSLLSEEASQIIQKAYHDADDYDAVVQLLHTIGEPRLRELVAQSISALEALGHRVDQDK